MDKSYFDEKWDRWGQDALKWDAIKSTDSSLYTPVKKEDVVPMWIADTDFATAPSVVKALNERIEHPLFGYFELPDRYVEAIANWQKTRFGTQGIKRENIMYHNSVLGGVASCIIAYTLPGDNILVNQTTYTGFQGTVKNLGRYLCYSELIQDDDGVYHLDLEDMEKKIIENKIPLMIFCSPHNPTGRVWTKEEITSVVDLCAKHDVKLISDEIWADFIVNPNCKHIPTQSVSDTAKKITMAMYAPSKTFNLAGLVGSFSIIYDKAMNNRISVASQGSHYNGINVLSVHACIGGYEGGAEYVDEMNKYIRKNQETLVNFFRNECKGVSTNLPDGTYLIWASFEDTGLEIGDIYNKFMELGLVVNDGRTFHGKTHLRFNCATQHDNILKAIEIMKKVLPLK